MMCRMNTIVDIDQQTFSLPFTDAQIGAALPIINQMPVIFGIKDLSSRYRLTNQMTAELLGFRTPGEIIDNELKDEHFRCKAAELAETFYQEDHEAITNCKTKTYFTKMTLVNGRQTCVLGPKKPYFDIHGNVIGSMFCYVDITNRYIINHDRLVEYARNCDTNRKNDGQFSFEITKLDSNFNLSVRQQECLFYMLRGYSAKGIACRLDISSKTVESHIVELKRKLDCCTKQQVIEKSINHGLLDVIPESIFKDLLAPIT